MKILNIYNSKSDRGCVQKEVLQDRSDGNVLIHKKIALFETIHFHCTNTNHKTCVCLHLKLKMDQKSKMKLLVV